jgi:hypothetical protein
MWLHTGWPVALCAGVPVRQLACDPVCLCTGQQAWMEKTKRHALCDLN